MAKEISEDLVWEGNTQTPKKEDIKDTEKKETTTPTTKKTTTKKTTISASSIKKMVEEEFNKNLELFKQSYKGDLTWQYKDALDRETELYRKNFEEKVLNLLGERIPELINEYITNSEKELNKTYTEKVEGLQKDIQKQFNMYEEQAKKMQDQMLYVKATKLYANAELPLTATAIKKGFNPRKIEELIDWFNRRYESVWISIVKNDYDILRLPHNLHYIFLTKSDFEKLGYKGDLRKDTDMNYFRNLLDMKGFSTAYADDGSLRISGWANKTYSQMMSWKYR